jgi:predicted nucleic-acid-binding Zn-ribbon protein
MKDYLIECCQCKWTGKESQRKEIKADPGYESYITVCPKCESVDFYILSINLTNQTKMNNRNV